MSGHGFQNPQAFFLLWLLPGLWLAAWAGMRLRIRDIRRFYRGRLPRRGEITGGAWWSWWGKTAAVSIAAAMLATALARPVWGYRMERSERFATDVVLCVDTSRSMLAVDAPGGRSRLEFAKLKAGMLLDGLEGERVALVAFAGEGVLACPFTYDVSAPKELLAAITSGAVPLGGTRLAAAVDKAMEMFERNGSAARAIVIVSDGDDHYPDALRKSLEAAAGNAAVFILGTGSEKGAPVRVAAGEGRWEYIKDADGAVVETKLNEELMLELARAAGGAYARASGGNEDIRTIIAGIAAINPGRAGEVVMKVPVERYVYPVAAAFVLLLAVMLLPATRTAKGGEE
ncbi:MAG TPA: VWA domain-containing protein [Planctomycetes bacterium]|nr:VWA domain-containing protein [Planctomycetota bacterium]